MEDPIELIDKGSGEVPPDHGELCVEPRPGQRVTVNLTPRAVAALDEITGLTGDSKTEAINKALQTYAIIQRGQAAGGGAWIQDRSGTQPVLSRFF